jgi:hypothetical protein
MLIVFLHPLSLPIVAFASRSFCFPFSLTRTLLRLLVSPIASVFVPIRIILLYEITEFYTGQKRSINLCPCLVPKCPAIALLSNVLSSYNQLRQSYDERKS